jgi:hypothetical protein
MVSLAKPCHNRVSEHTPAPRGAVGSTLRINHSEAYSLNSACTNMAESDSTEQVAHM